ncbi:MAG TPA: Gfo/Idh/MocA family oxidoreductase [Capillimicrobium sp.]|jgi:predicted dehydrogenase
MTDLRSLRAGVVGTGFIGVVHVEALRRLGVEVLGVVGSSPERAREKARTAVLPEPYPSFEALLADERVDVVHITSPNHLHHAQVRAALEAGKHVVCEKPLALTSAETADLLAVAEERGLVHAVNFNIRFYAQCREARERVGAGELGDVRLVTGSYLQDWLLHETDWNWRLDPEQGGALRAVGDIGTHWIDLVQYMTGLRVEAVLADLVTAIPVRRVPVGPVETFAGKAGEAAGATVDREMRTEDLAAIVLRLEGGARAVASVSQVSAGRKNACSLEIDGARSALAWTSERPEELWLGHRDRPNELLLRDPSLMTPGAAQTSVLPGGHAEGFADTFRELYRAVYDAVADGGPPAAPTYPTFADGHDEALICEAIERSAREERWVAIDRTDPQEVSL